MTICGVEQLVARQAHNLEAAGSSPAPATKLVEGTCEPDPSTTAAATQCYPLRRLAAATLLAFALAACTPPARETLTSRPGAPPAEALAKAGWRAGDLLSYARGCHDRAAVAELAEASRRGAAALNRAWSLLIAGRRCLIMDRPIAAELTERINLMIVVGDSLFRVWRLRDAAGDEEFTWLPIDGGPGYRAAPRDAPIGWPAGRSFSEGWRI